MMTLAAARSVARAALTRIRGQRKAHAIVLHRGEAEIHRMLSAYDDRLPDAWCGPNGQLVGVYDQHADLDDIAADILAAQAGEYGDRQAR